MSGQSQRGATSGPAPISSTQADEIEAALASIRRLSAERSGLAMPPWTGHERPPAPRPAPERAAAPPPPLAPVPPPREARSGPAAVRAAATGPKPAPAASKGPAPLMLTPDRRVPDPRQPLGALPLVAPVAVPDAARDDGALRERVAAILVEALRGEPSGPRSEAVADALRALVREEVRRALAERDGR